jgi:hypothetical protein
LLGWLVVNAKFKFEINFIPPTRDIQQNKNRDTGDANHEKKLMVTMRTIPLRNWTEIFIALPVAIQQFQCFLKFLPEDPKASPVSKKLAVLAKYKMYRYV